ncbi:MAG TPA: TolC family protein, partial [Bacteroidota bacterium]|nr:TolC family protein [Bacteroidota bacterium]
QGTAKRSEYLLMSIEVEGKAAAAADAYVQYAVNLRQLNSLCGLDDTTSSAVLDTVHQDLARSGREDRAFIKKFELDSLAALSQQELAETKYQPQVSVFFNTGLNAVELDGIERKFGLSAGFNLSIPLFDGNQRSITRQQNQLSLETIGNYKEQFALQQKLQRSSSLARLDGFRLRLGALSRQIIDYTELMRISESELRRGQLSAIEYLTVLRNYIDLKKERISTETEMQREINNYNYWN